MVPKARDVPKTSSTGSRTSVRCGASGRFGRRQSYKLGVWFFCAPAPNCAAGAGAAEGGRHHVLLHLHLQPHRGRGGGGRAAETARPPPRAHECHLQNAANTNFALKIIKAGRLSVGLTVPIKAGLVNVVVTTSAVRLTAAQKSAIHTLPILAMNAHDEYCDNQARIASRCIVGSLGSRPCCQARVILAWFFALRSVHKHTYHRGNI